MTSAEVCVFSPFSSTITSFGKERAYLSAFRAFVRFVLVWFCRFPLPLGVGVWEGLRFVIVALPGLFSHPFFLAKNANNKDINRFLYSKCLILLTYSFFELIQQTIEFA